MRKSPFSIGCRTLGCRTFGEVNDLRRVREFDVGETATAADGLDEKGTAMGLDGMSRALRAGRRTVL